MKYLTTSQKDRYLKILVKRDGDYCFYCKESFSIEDKSRRRTYDHLNDNNKDNRLENLVLCHWSCNQMKKSYPEYKLMAQDKIKELGLSFDSLGVCVNPTPTDKEIDLNVAMNKHVKEFLQEHLLNKGKPALELNDTAHSLSYLFKEKTGHGSSASFLRHLKDHCSSVAPFKLEEQEGKWFIVKRH